MTQWTDEQIELRMGRLLQAGVTAAAAAMLIGAALYLVRHGHEVPHYSQFHGEPEDLRNVLEILRGAIGNRARSIIQVGVLLMIATPVLRVAFAAFAFAREHDRLYVVISLIVLGLLAYGLLGGQ